MEGIRVWSRCQQQEDGEKSNRFFLNLGARFPDESKFIVSNQEITNPQTIEHEIKAFSKTT